MALNDKLTLAESLARMSELKQKLQDLGVPEEAVDGVMEHIDEYVSLQDGLELARANQFHDASYDILVQLKASSNKNVEVLSAWLRRFALHVAFQTVLLTQVHGGRADVIVDYMPSFEESN